ncbi:MAG: hypothetical protein ACK5PP_05890 [Acidimicrobiales bacterium]
MIIEDDRPDAPPFVRPVPGATVPGSERPSDRAREFLEQWRPGMLLLLVPFAVAVLALILSWQPDPQDDAAVTIPSGAAESGSLGGLNLAAPAPAPSTAPPLTTAPPATLYASTTAPATTAPPTSTRATRQAPATTAAPSPTTGATRPPATEAPTTVTPPPTVTEPAPPPEPSAPSTDACVIRVRRADVYATPDDAAERIGRANGRYTVTGAQAGWYQIASGDESGWVRSSEVSRSSGSC